MSRSNNEYTGIKGVAIDPVTHEPIHVAEEDHYYTCADCGQSVDRRDLGEVFHHEDEEHKPLPVN